MFASKVVLFALFVVAPAFSQTVIMGHHIGEDVSQFLAEEPALQGGITSCRADEPRPLTPEQIHGLSRQDVEWLASQVYRSVLNSTDPKYQIKLKRMPSRSDLERLAGQGMPVVIDKRMPDVVAVCHSLLALTAPPSSVPMLIQSLPDSKPRPLTWYFKNGILFRIDIDFDGGDFSKISSDFTGKTGVAPIINNEIDTPNLYGATVNVSRKAIWLTPELYALLEEDAGTAAEQIRAFIISRAEYDVWIKSHAKRNSFD